jgi:WD40 repeat protein
MPDQTVEVGSECGCQVGSYPGYTGRPLQTGTLRPPRGTTSAQLCNVPILAITSVHGSRHRWRTPVFRPRNSARSWLAVPRHSPLARSHHVLSGYQSAVSSAAFSADGTRIVTASWDKTARIWDAATGNEIRVLRGHEDFVNSAAFSADGTRIVTASDDSTARIWDVHFATMAIKNLLIEVCGHRLVGISNLTRDDMRLLGFGDDQPEIDVCEGVR